MQQPHQQGAIDVPCMTYYYREVIEKKENDETSSIKYQLEALVPSTKPFFYSRGGIARSTLVGADLAQLQFFDEVLLAECNALSLRIVLITISEGAYVCEPTLRGTLNVLSHAADPPPYTNGQRAYMDADPSTMHGATVYTWFHQFKAMAGAEGHYLHQGLTLLPSKVFGMPVYLTDHNLRQVLQTWAAETHASRLFAHLSVRDARDDISMRRVVPLSAWSESSTKRYPHQSDKHVGGLRQPRQPAAELGWTRS